MSSNYPDLSNRDRIVNTHATNGRHQIINVGDERKAVKVVRINDAVSVGRATKLTRPSGIQLNDYHVSTDDPGR